MYVIRSRYMPILLKMSSVIGPDMVKNLLYGNVIILHVQREGRRGNSAISNAPNTPACVVIDIYTHNHAHSNYPIHWRWVDVPGLVGRRKILVQLLYTFLPDRGSRFQALSLALYNQEFVSFSLTRQILISMQV